MAAANPNMFLLQWLAAAAVQRSAIRMEELNMAAPGQVTSSTSSSTDHMSPTLPQQLNNQNSFAEAMANAQQLLAASMAAANIPTRLLMNQGSFLH